jgi:hypothetical protein
MSVNLDDKQVKKEKIVNCRFTDKWLNPKSKKFVYYHELITDEGNILNIGSVEKNSIRIKAGATIEYIVDENGKTKIISSSNDASKIAEKVLIEKENSKNNFIPGTKMIKGQETFLGYAWSYAKDLVIAGKTMKDIDELNKIARFIYGEIGKMLHEDTNIEKN